MNDTRGSEGRISIAVEGATFAYGDGDPVFTDVSFALAAGDILTILGGNGAGKSTLLNCMTGMYGLRRGRIEVNGRDVGRCPPDKLARELAYVPQTQAAAFDYSVRDYVVMGRAPHIGFLSAPDAVAYRKADEALEKMRIAHLADKSCRNISGGERQQVQIARALVQETEILLMDEPTNHLDYGNQVRILRTIAELSERGFIVVLTTHVPDHAILLEGRTAILGRDGRMRVGAAREIVNEENLRAVYGGGLHVVYVEELGRPACLPGAIR